MITIEVERAGDHTDNARLSVNPGEVVKLTLFAELEDLTCAERLASCTDAELSAELTRRLRRSESM